MSRLSTLSPTALQAMFGQETDKELILLLTIYDPSNSTQVVLRLADGFTQRLTETADDVTYGVISRSNSYIFLPMEITMPDESDSSAPKCSITLHDVTRYVMPVARTIEGQPKVKLELIVSSTPNVVEASFSSFYITNFSYTADRVNIEMSMIGYEREPFPQYSFTPAYFPGLF